jgi:hypothetical protein
MRIGQGVGYTNIDQASFLAARDDLDRYPQHTLGLGEETARILCHAQRIGRNGPHGIARKTAQTFVEAAQCGQRTRTCGVVKHAIGCQTCSKPHRLLQAIEGVDLIVDDLADLKPEAVGTQIDRGDQFMHDVWASAVGVQCGCAGFYHSASARTPPVGDWGKLYGGFATCHQNVTRSVQHGPPARMRPPEQR